MNKKYSLLIFLSLGVLLVPMMSHAQVPAHCTPKRFRVTAYYSPLPDQAFYNMNSYEEEKIMNGNGTHGASGRAVFDGMIAAPKSYAFGTQIVFPGWGIGQVEDRGGWIVEEGERGEKYDRIDFWVGKGHDGLRRALSFGVQYIDAYVCSSGTYSENQVGFDYDAFPYYSDFFERMLRVISMRPGRNDLMVKSLQYFLAHAGYLSSADTTGFYGPKTTAAVCKFQQETLGLPAYHESCGRFGPQTRYALNQKMKQRGWTLSGIREQFATSQETVITQSHAEHLEIETHSDLHVEPKPLDWLFGPGGEFESYMFIRPLVLNESSSEVRILQRKLQWMGYVEDDYEISGVYDTDTIQALYRLQLDQGLLTGNEDPNVRGYFGPSTRKVINAF